MDVLNNILKPREEKPFKVIARHKRSVEDTYEILAECDTMAECSKFIYHLKPKDPDFRYEVVVLA
jgi:hypothetical protein